MLCTALTRGISRGCLTSLVSISLTRRRPGAALSSDRHDVCFIPMHVVRAVRAKCYIIIASVARRQNAPGLVLRALHAVKMPM